MKKKKILVPVRRRISYAILLHAGIESKNIRKGNIIKIIISTLAGNEIKSYYNTNFNFNKLVN